MPQSGTLIPQDRKPEAPADQASLSDQEQFDTIVDRDSRVVLAILGGVAIIAALAMSTVALVLSSGSKSTTIETRTVTAAAAKTATTAAAPLIRLSIEGGVKRGPDGKLHDAFSKTNFNVKVGQPVRLQIDNKDDAPHSITSAAAGVSVIALPGTHTYTMVVKTAGRFEWLCILPCDSDAAGWAMTHRATWRGTSRQPRDCLGLDSCARSAIGRNFFVFGLGEGGDVVQVDRSAGCALHPYEVVTAGDGDLMAPQFDHERALTKLQVGGGAGGVVEYVDVAQPGRELPQRRSRQHFRLDPQMLAARVEDARAELDERAGEASEVVRSGGRDQIDIVGHAHVAVDLYRDASHHDVVHFALIEGREDALGVERSRLRH